MIPAEFQAWLDTLNTEAERAGLLGWPKALADLEAMEFDFEGGFVLGLSPAEAIAAYQRYFAGQGGAWRGLEIIHLFC
jgi:hypothetical protein